MTDPFSLRTTLGPTVVHIEPEEVAAAVARVQDGEAQALIDEANRQFRTDEVKPDLYCARPLCRRDEKVVREHKLDAVAHFDQCLLSDPRWIGAFMGRVSSWRPASGLG